MSGLFIKHGRALIENGYAIIPIPPGRKGPVIDDWQRKFAKTQERFEEIASDTDHRRDGIGILTKQTPAVDIDCYDRDIVDSCIQWCLDNIGDAPLRIGNAPKALLLYAADKPFSKITSARYYDPSNPEKDPKRKGQRLEILGDGQQFVAYHIHPETKKPYEWVNDWENPLDIPAIDLTVITPEHARLACLEFERLCEEAGWERIGVGSATTAAETDADGLSEITPPEETDDEVERLKSALTAIEGDVASGYDYDQWRNVLFALKWTRWDCAESLAREWSETSDKHNTREFNVVWRGAQKRDRGREITLGSIFKLAKDAGWDSSRAPTAEEIKATIESLSQMVEQLAEVDDTHQFVGEIIKKMTSVTLSSAAEGQLLKGIKKHTGWSITDLRRDLNKARRAHVKEESFMPTHAGYAAHMIDRLESKCGIRPIGTEGMIYTYSEGKGIWKGKFVTDFAVDVAAMFDGQENCSRRNDYLAVSQQAYSVLSEGREEFFSQAPVGLACKGRFYRLNDEGTIEREELDHTHRQRVLSPVQPKVGPTPLFDKFLKEAFEGDQDNEQSMLLQEVMGAMILGIMARYERVLLIKGPGRSGKGTIMKVMQAMLPKEVVSAVSPFRWDSEYYVANLSGKRLNIVGELPDDEPIPANAFKTITGRDLLTGRHPTHRPFSFMSEAAHIFNSNHFIYTKEQSEAFYSRWLLMEFRNSRVGRESEQNVRLADEIIEKELPGIMAWALQGAKRLQGRGHFMTTKVQIKMLAQWRLRTSTLLEFLLDRDVCRLGNPKTHVTRRSEFYRAYTEWCKESNRRPMGKQKLYDELDGDGPQGIGVKRGSDTKGVDVVRGVVIGNENWVVSPDDDDW